MAVVNMTLAGALLARAQVSETVQSTGITLNALPGASRLAISLIKSRDLLLDYQKKLDDLIEDFEPKK